MDVIALRFASLLRSTVLRSLKPKCSYDKEHDWLVYLACECAYVAVATNDPRLSLLQVDDRVVGVRVAGFLQLPRHMRNEILVASAMDLDDIRGIEEIWIKNVLEARDEIFAAQAAFFAELRRREAARER